MTRKTNRIKAFFISLAITIIIGTVSAIILVFSNELFDTALERCFWCALVLAPFISRMYGVKFWVDTFRALASIASANEIEARTDRKNEEVSKLEKQVSEKVSKPEKKANKEDNKANDKTEPWAIILGFSFIAIVLILGVIARLA